MYLIGFEIKTNTEPKKAIIDWIMNEAVPGSK